MSACCVSINPREQRARFCVRAIAEAARPCVSRREKKRDCMTWREAAEHDDDVACLESPEEGASPSGCRRRSSRQAGASAEPADLRAKSLSFISGCGVLSP